MIIRCLFIQRKEKYEGEYAPELLVAADEGTLEENPDYFREESQKQLAAVGDEVASSVVMDFSVSTNQIKLFLKPATIPVVEVVKIEPAPND